MFRDPPLPGPCAPPPGGRRAPQHSHSPAGDRRASAPPPPPEPGLPPTTRPGRGPCPGRAGADSPEPPPPPQPARPPRCPLGSSPRPWRRSAAPPLHPPSSLRTCGWEAETARPPGGRRESSPRRAPRPALPWRSRRPGSTTFRAPGARGCPPTAPIFSGREVGAPSRLSSRDLGYGAPAHLHSQIQESTPPAPSSRAQPPAPPPQDAGLRLAASEAPGAGGAGRRGLGARRGSQPRAELPQAPGFQSCPAASCLCPLALCARSPSLLIKKYGQ